MITLSAQSVHTPFPTARSFGEPKLKIAKASMLSFSDHDRQAQAWDRPTWLQPTHASVQVTQCNTFSILFQYLSL